jgi:predicted RNA-binding protein with EMAP domain
VVPVPVDCLIKTRVEIGRRFEEVQNPSELKQQERYAVAALKSYRLLRYHSMVDLSPSSKLVDA